MLLTLRNRHFENQIWSNLAYPFLVASFGLATFSLTKDGAVNIRVWEILMAIYIVISFTKCCAVRSAALTNRLALILPMLFLLSVLLSGLNADRIDFWAKQSVLLCAMVILFMLVSQRWARAQILQNIRWVIYPGVLIAAWGMLEMLLNPTDLPLYYSDGLIMPRAQSLFAEPNEFSQFLALPFAYLFSSVLYFRNASMTERGFFWGGLLVVFFAQVFSFSRGGMVVFLSQIITWYFLTTIFSTKRRNISWQGISAFIGFFVVMTIIMAGQDLSDIISVFLERIQSLFSGDDATSKIRWDGIIVAITATVSSPLNFVFGIGLGNLTLLLGDGVATTSNILVDVLSELGMLGLISFLAILGGALIYPLRTLRHLFRRNDHEMLTAFFGAYLSFVGLIAGGLTYATHMLNIFWFSCGLLFALSNFNKVANIRQEKYL